MRSVATLKLPEEEVEVFQAALRRYGFERGAHFLRACAHALMEHDHKGERLISPLEFQRGEQSD